MLRALVFSLGYALLIGGFIIIIYYNELFWVGAGVSLAGAIQFFKDLP